MSDLTKQSGAPIPDGATIGGSQGTGAGAAIPQGATIGSEPAQGAPPPPQGSTAANLMEGAGAGAYETGAGLSELGNKIPGMSYLSQKVGNGIAHVAGAFGNHDFEQSMLGTTTETGQKAAKSESDDMKQDALQSTAGNIGYGGESLVEFMLGDEALKGLSIADKMLQAGKVAKLLEGSPKLVQALKAGANIEKAKMFLSPEARAAIENSPYLGRLVSAGMEAVRAGTVSTVQDFARTGDASHALHEGLQTAKGAAIIGVPLAGVGGALQKFGKAGRTILQGQELGTVARQAQGVAADSVDSATGLAAAGPSEGEIASKASDLVNNANNIMHNRYASRLEDEVRKPLRGDEIDMTGSAVQAKAKEVLGLTENKDAWLKVAKETTPVSSDAKDYIRQVANALQKPVSKAEAAAKKDDAFTTKFFGPEVSGVGDPAAGGAGASSAAGGTTAASKPYMLNIDNLTKQRQILMERAREARKAGEWGDAKAYSMVIDGIDQSIEDLATSSGKSSVANSYSDLRKQYGAMKEQFDNPDARAELQSMMRGGNYDLKNILLGNSKNASRKLAAMKEIARQSGQDFQPISDGIFHDVMRDGPEKLLSAPSEKLDRIRAVVGDDNFAKLSSQVTDHVVSQGADKLFKMTPTKLNDMRNLVGDDNMGKIVEAGVHKLFDAARNERGSFDAEEMVRQVEALHVDRPSTLRTLQGIAPRNMADFKVFMDDMKDAASMKKLVRLGLMPSTAVLVGGAAHHFFGTFGLITSAILSMGGYRNAREWMDRVAASPKLWSAFTTVDEHANSVGGKEALNLGQSAAKGTIAKPIADVADKVMNGVKGALGGN